MCVRVGEGVRDVQSDRKSFIGIYQLQPTIDSKTYACRAYRSSTP